MKLLILFESNLSPIESDFVSNCLRAAGGGIYMTASRGKSYSPFRGGNLDRSTCHPVNFARFVDKGSTCIPEDHLAGVLGELNSFHNGSQVPCPGIPLIFIRKS